MKKHPLLTVSSILALLNGAASLALVVWNTMFQVMLSDTEDPTVNIALLACFSLTAIASSLFLMVAGSNAIRGGSLHSCRQAGMSGILFCALAGLTGYMTNQIWFCYPIGVIIGILYVTGVQKTIDA